MGPKFATALLIFFSRCLVVSSSKVDRASSGCLFLLPEDRGCLLYTLLFNVTTSKQGGLISVLMSLNTHRNCSIIGTNPAVFCPIIRLFWITVTFLTCWKDKDLMQALHIDMCPNLSRIATSLNLAYAWKFSS